MLSLIHISEPTRLGMISYAVFCLKKKRKTTTTTKQNKTTKKKVIWGTRAAARRCPPLPGPLPGVGGTAGSVLQQPIP